MGNAYSSLEDVLNDTDFGNLFDTKTVAKKQNADQRLIESFEDINKFIDTHGHNPCESSDINKRRLFARLKALCEDSLKCEMLREYDRHGILPQTSVEPQSLNDILTDSFFDNLTNSDDAGDIFSLKYVKHSSQRESSDWIARRKVCKDFAQYEPLFKQCQIELKSGTRKLLRFNEANLDKNVFFVVNGLLGYLAATYNLHKDKEGKTDGRTYCVFENGTESNMRFRSLCKRLYENGKTVSVTNDETLAEFNSNFNLPNTEDNQTGYIYVLKSKSTNPKIADIDNLYKIGYSTIPVEDRIKNALQEPTYLMAHVEIVSIYQCYNLNPQKFEQIVHKFLGKSCLNLDIFGADGKRYTPREWFIVPLPIIEETIQLIISEKITDYYYDATKQEILSG